MRFKIVLIIVIILISSVYAELQPGKLWINNVFIPSGLEKEIELEKPTIEPKQISYVYANNQRIAKVENNEVFYFHNDHLGSPRVITDSKGNVVEKIDYLPFGESINGEEKVGYNSKELDFDTKLNYYGARYYSSPTGRFITADTVKGSLADPQSLNLYVYVKNNPMKYVDPSGNTAMKEIQNKFGGVRPMRFGGLLTPSLNQFYQSASDITGLSAPFIAAAHMQEGLVQILSRADAIYIHNHPVMRKEMYEDHVRLLMIDEVPSNWWGLDTLYEDLGYISKIPEMNFKYALRERGPGGSHEVVINLENSIKATAGMLMSRRGMLEKDVLSKWGKETWEAMSTEQKDFWTYVYFNLGHSYSKGKNLGGKGLLYERGVDWMYSTPKDYKQVHFNAARTVGGAELVKERGDLE